MWSLHRELSGAQHTLGGFLMDQQWTGKKTVNFRFRHIMPPDGTYFQTELFSLLVTADTEHLSLLMPQLLNVSLINKHAVHNGVVFLLKSAVSLIRLFWKKCLSLFDRPQNVAQTQLRSDVSVGKEASKLQKAKKKNTRSCVISNFKIK